jgi:hypothetical protein
MTAQAIACSACHAPRTWARERPTMSVSESERHQLFTWFEEHMGQERAATMMNLVPPVGWADVATKHDIDELDARLASRFEAIDSKFEALDSKFEALDSKFEAIDSKFEALEHQFDAKLYALRYDLLRTLGTWLFASQAAVIAAISVVIALIAIG